MVRSVRRLLLCLLLPMVVSATVLTAGTIKPLINNTVEYGVATECKTCPYSLCTNGAFYGSGTVVGLVCWTRGKRIDNDTTWLQTTDGCYVTQDDLTNYNGTYETDLSFCGEDSEEKHLTFDTTMVEYDEECMLCPDNVDCETVKYLSAGTEITVTCWTSEGLTIAGDTTFLKTTDNCYVAEVGLQDLANKDILDNCGPVGFLQPNDTVLKRGKSSRSLEPITLPTLAKDPEPVTDINSQYLLNITVGEDYAYCYSCANSTCDIVTRYPWAHEVWVQCYVDNEAASNPNETWWYETTDFCYVHEGDFEQSLFDL
ncbi:hypothetical protein EG329_003991 [Mollisiaceae sp. DMI_Dod_QoI]|nr:hypothetical protein EG329_003991 [Helotiales sp. DMI_Dod_QoI]